MIENNLSEEDIIEIYDNNWYDISSHQYLTEHFMRCYEEELLWKNISEKQNLSENFILDFKSSVDWIRISKYQKLSFKFIKNNIEKLNVCGLLENKNISEEIKQYIRIL